MWFHQHVLSAWLHVGVLVYMCSGITSFSYVVPVAQVRWGSSRAEHK